MKPILLLIIILLLSSALAQAKVGGNLLSAQGIEFTENRGQLRYDNGSPAGDILFTAQVAGQEVYVRRTGLSFVMYSTLTPGPSPTGRGAGGEGNASTSSATGISNLL